MGVAMWSTLLAMFVTAFGALSLSTDPDVVRASYWLKLEAVNGTAGGATAKYYLGLRSVVTRPRDPVQREVLDACAAGAAGNQIGALLSCVTLIFALLGTINRMRFSSDANVQKALGLVTDTWGAATLTWTLAHFHLRCFAGLPARHGALELEHAWGPAWVCYLVCCLSGIIRAAAHWVTPTPGNGAGACVFSLPQRILRVLEADLGDALSYAEQKRTYKLLRAAMAEEGHVVNAFVRESLAKVSGALRDAAGGVENAVAALVGDARRATGVAGPEANGGLDDAALRVALTVAAEAAPRPAKRDLFEGSAARRRGDLARRTVRAASMPSLLLGLVDERHPPEPVRVQPSFGAGEETRPPEGA
ncbi:oxidoreductase family [Aureococcus anophagefferens]|nr:oxidoreductase family [Aureococcus anophagefferens]